MRQKIQALQKLLNQGLVGRQETINIALLAMLAGENVLLIGPPGTAKSMIARRISQALQTDTESGDYFEYLLTKFSTPEEIFGPLSISGLKQDRYHRNTDGYLPTARVAFLDEIFKASSSILNSLLTILNERKYHNGSQIQKIPLQALVAASNELPKGQPELTALYDRFLLRCFVGPLNSADRSGLFKLVQAPDIPAKTRLRTNEIINLQKSAQEVTLPEKVRQVITHIWDAHAEKFKDNVDEQLSDRRFTKVLHLLRIAAASNGRTEVDLSDVLLLKDCLWNNDENAPTVLKLLQDSLRQFDQRVPEKDEEDLSAPTALPATEPRAVKIEGYQGSGTLNDPLLVENTEHLYRLLTDEDVGGQGYYFRQTTNLDVSALLGGDIAFQGHYDGGGYCISYKSEEDAEHKPIPLFGTLQKSSVSALKLSNISLASSADSSRIQLIETSDTLLESAQDCTIINCTARTLINGSVAGSTINQCQSLGRLVKDTATDTKIDNCRVNLTVTARGGIARELKNSHVRRCFVTGSVLGAAIGATIGVTIDRMWGGVLLKPTTSTAFSGTADQADDGSSISACAIGSHPRLVQHTTGLLLICATPNGATLRNNIVLDSNPQKYTRSDDPDDKVWQTVHAEMITQSFFENILHWDFDTVWAWDEEANEPILQMNKLRIGTTATVSLLLKQLRRNIWFTNPEV